jgi:hypothetical protein
MKPINILRDVWIRTERAAVASNRANYNSIHVSLGLWADKHLFVMLFSVYLQYNIPSTAMPFSLRYAVIYLMWEWPFLATVHSSLSKNSKKIKEVCKTGLLYILYFFNVVHTLSHRQTHTVAFYPNLSSSFQLLKHIHKKNHILIIWVSFWLHLAVTLLYSDAVFLLICFFCSGGMEKYENLGIIGEGSYGVVIKCRHKETGQVSLW